MDFGVIELAALVNILFENSTITSRGKSTIIQNSITVSKVTI